MLTCSFLLQSPCTIVNSTTLTCVTPGFDGDVGSINYTLLLDDAPFPASLEGALQLSLRPDPSGFELVTESVIVGTTTFIQITVSTYVHTYIRTYIHTFIHTYIHTYVHTYIHSYIHTYVHTYIHSYIHTYIHAYIHTYIHSYIHTYIHYIHTYIHTLFTGP